LTPGDPLNLQPGEFAISSTSSMTVRLQTGLTPGAAISFRLIINGAENAPAWVVP
jgi:hypothetical protein